MEKNMYLTILKLFANKGIRFTTEDLARELGTSKRTIYSYFSTKDEMIEKTIDFVFREMLTSDTEILEKEELSIQEKIKLYFENIPDAYSLGTIVKHMDELKRHCPDLWEKVNHYLNTTWDPILQLIEEGIQRGELEEVNTRILKMMLFQTQKTLLDYEFLAKNQISFDDAFNAMNKILLYGLIKREDV